MAASEVVEILKNDGFVYCDGMVLTNFVSKGNDHILMFGTWFDTETSGHGNERRIFGDKVENWQEGLDHKSFKLGDLMLIHHFRKTEWNNRPFEMFERVQKVKSRLKYDFEAAQKNIMRKFD